MPAPNLKPDDPCGCGNGRRYADCHGQVHAAPAEQRIEVAQAVYAEEWASNASCYDSQGLYTGLAGELVKAGEVRRVLDIGCGLGQGLAAVLEAIPAEGRLVVGIDENPVCLAAASKRLALPVDSALLQRTKTEILPNETYRITPSAEALPPAQPVVLLNVDLMLKDPAFEAWLDAIGPLDAVTLWFSGVHKARAEVELVGFFDIQSDRDHRELLEDMVFDLAERRLRSGGVLQIVNRAAGPDLAALEYMTREELDEILEDRPLEVVSVTARRYTEPSSGGIVVTSKTVSAGANTAAVSIIVRRR